MLRQLEPSRSADVTSELRERRLRQEAALEVLDSSAAATDQMVMVSGELFSQLVPLASAERGRERHGVRRAD